ncbi:MAG: GNAT family N-acetyltransferase [bacterium]|nr:GNAT family N-acetyltransferase [bacterium]
MSALARVETAPSILVTTYLEMTSRAAFRPSYVQGGHFAIELMKHPDVHFYRFLYGAVGEVWRWRDRLVMPDAELEAILCDPTVSVDVLYVGGVPAGYVELKRDGDDIEVAYFGLRTRYFGMGLGKHLLSHGVARAWQDGARRVWLHTCNLDSPHALDNYLKRGFRVFKVVEEAMPDLYS